MSLIYINTLFIFVCIDLFLINIAFYALILLQWHPHFPFGIDTTDLERNGARLHAHLSCNFVICRFPWVPSWDGQRPVPSQRLHPVPGHKMTQRTIQNHRCQLNLQRELRNFVCRVRGNQIKKGAPTEWALTFKWSCLWFLRIFSRMARFSFSMPSSSDFLPSTGSSSFIS